jgi:hypothetical protein
MSRTFSVVRIAGLAGAVFFMTVLGSCAQRDDGLRIGLPAGLSALSVADAAALTATIEIPGVLAETRLQISSDLSEATGSFVVDVPSRTAAPFTLRLRYQPNDSTNVLLARLEGQIDIVPNEDNAVEAEGGYDTCGAATAGGPCALAFDLNRNGATNLEDLIAGFDPLPPPPFVDVAPKDLAFPSGIRLGAFSRQVIVIENSSASPIEVSATLIDAPGATLQPFEVEPSPESAARRSLALGVLNPFEEVLVAVSFAPVNPFLTVGDIFVEARDPRTNVRQATRVRLLANVDGELQPPPLDFNPEPLAAGADLGGFEGTVEIFSRTSLFNGLPVTSVQSPTGAVSGLPFIGKSIVASFAAADGGAETAAVPADAAFLVEIPAEHKLAVTLSGLETDIDLAVFLLAEGDDISADPANNRRVAKSGTSAEAVELANETSARQRALVVLGRVEIDPPPAAVGALSADVPAPFALSAHVTSAPEFTAPLDPPGGPLEGGTRVTLRGKRFHPNARITFADAIGLDCTYREEDTDTLFDCNTPPGSLVIGKNPATIVVANPERDEGGDGQAATLPEGFTYEPPAPRVDAILPSVAPTTGSTEPVVLRGAFFSRRNGVPRVHFDGVAAPGVELVDSTRLQVRAPPHAPGIIVVTVQNVLDPQPGDAPEFVRLSLPSNARNFTYVTPDSPPPGITTVDPTTGSVDGGEVITLRGDGFLPGASVLLDGEAATDIEVVAGDTIVCRTPARSAAGAARLEVINPDGQRAALANAFTYFIPDPSIRSVFPDTATVAGGTFVVVDGTGFRAGVRVQFVSGSTVLTSPNVQRVSATTILAATPVAPPPGGTYSVRVSNLAGAPAILADAFRFLEPNGPPPRITSLSPNAGDKDQPVVVTLTGAELRGSPPSILAGARAAEVVDFSTAGAVDTVTFIMPTSATPGPIVVRVINDDGQSDTDVYTYFTVLGAPPVFDTISPSSARKNDTLTVVGRSFDVVSNGQGGTVLAPGARLLVGGQLVQPLTATSTRLTLRVPDLDALVGPGGATVAVELTNSDGQSTSAPFVYAVNVAQPPPVIDSITPDSVQLAGGTVTLRGSGFSAQGTLTVGGVGVSASVAATSIAFVAPPREATGAVVVRFRNPDGQSTSASLVYADVQVGPGPIDPPLIGLLSPATLHALVPGDTVDLFGQSLSGVQSVSVEDDAGAPIGSAVVVGATSSVVRVVVTTPLPDTRFGPQLRFRVQLPGGQQIVSPSFSTAPPRLASLFGNLRGFEPVFLFGDDFNPARLVDLELTSPAAIISVPILSRSETMVQTAPFPPAVPGVTSELVLVYSDPFGGALIRIPLENAPPIAEPPRFLVPSAFGDPLPAEQPPAALRAVARSFDFLGDPLFGAPTIFELFDGSGAVVGGGTWQLAGQSFQGELVSLTFTSSAPLPVGSYGVRLQTTATPALAESPPGGPQGLQFVPRQVNVVVPTVNQPGSPIAVAGTIFEGDVIAARNLDTQALTALGTASTTGCDPLTRGCSFAGGVSVPPVELAPGPYALCAVRAGAPLACNEQSAFLQIVAELDERVAFTTQDCQSVEHAFASGDDRGGIAVTPTRAYYTGDDATAIFTEGPPFVQPSAFRHDSIFADTRNGTVYVLEQNDGQALVAGSGPFQAERLGILDPATLAPTGGFLPLVPPISLDTNFSANGVFAGEGLLILFSQQTFSWHVVDLDTGVVTQLNGPFPDFMRTCESWAAWGVAERKGGNHLVTYAAADGFRIRQLEIETGSFQFVAEIGGLSDMCSIAALPSTSRWFFHYEGFGFAGGGDEIFGSCATINCGDGVCGFSEGFFSCPEDCSATCGDGLCEGPAETPTSCALDCFGASGPGEGFCGNGICEGDEPQFCPDDCQASEGFCGDGFCAPDEFEPGSPRFCPEDCSPN